MAMTIVEVDDTQWLEVYAKMRVDNTKSVDIQNVGSYVIFLWTDFISLPQLPDRGFRIEPGETRTIPAGYDPHIYIGSQNTTYAAIHV